MVSLARASLLYEWRHCLVDVLVRPQVSAAELDAGRFALGIIVEAELRLLDGLQQLQASAVQTRRALVQWYFVQGRR